MTTVALTPALSRGLRKALRTVLQVVAAGGLTTVVNELADGLDETGKLLVGAAWLIVVTFAQNTLESAGTIPTILPTTPLLPIDPPVIDLPLPILATAETVPPPVVISTSASSGVVISPPATSTATTSGSIPPITPTPTPAALEDSDRDPEDDDPDAYEHP